MDESAIIKIINGQIKTLPVKGDNVGCTIENSKKDGYLGNLSEKSVPELEDLLARQMRILENKSFISKLKDGGLKLQLRYEEICKALETVKLKKIHEVKILNNIEEFEWRDNKQNQLDDEDNKQNQLDDEDNNFVSEHENINNPLYLMATHSTTIPAKSQLLNEEDCSLKIIHELENLTIKDENISTIENKFSALTDEKNPIEQFSQDYKNHILTKLKSCNELVEKKQIFKTNRNYNGIIPSEGKSSRKTSLWVESSATGPVKPTRKIPVRLMSLEESFDLYNETEAKGKVKQMSSLTMSTAYSYKDVNTIPHVLRLKEDDDTFYK